MPGIAHTLYTTLEVLQFFGRFSFGSQKMSDTKNQPYEAQRE